MITKFDIFEGLIDDINSEFFRYNTKNAVRIKEFAFGYGYDDYLTHDEADMIRFLAVKYKESPPKDSNEYHHFYKDAFR